MRGFRVFGLLLLWTAVASAEDIVRESFEGPPRNDPLVNTWGDKPATVATNATVPEVGLQGSAAACLRLEFPGEVAGKRPVARGDLRAVLLGARRPELYRPLPEPEDD